MTEKKQNSAFEDISASVDPEEIAHFSALAARWWDPDGPFKPLHNLNPVRIGYARDSLCRHFGRTIDDPAPLDGLRILDIGCGGGLLSEPLTRLGARVVGADAAEKNIQVARIHARETGLTIDYRAVTAEQLAAAGEKFDAIVNMEVIEHVADIPSFLTACNQLLERDGVMVMSTLNRTMKSWVMAIAGAEYILRWLPSGTHNWHRFLKPSELVRLLTDGNFAVTELKGMVYHPFSGDWSLHDTDFSVNYLALARKRQDSG